MFTRYFYAILAVAVLAVAFVSAAITFPAAPVASAKSGGQITKVDGCHRPSDLTW